MTDKNKTKVEDIVAQGAFNVLKNDMLLHVEALQNEQQPDLGLAFGLGQTTTEYIENPENLKIVQKALSKEIKKTALVFLVLKHSSSLEEFVFLLLLIMEIKKIIVQIKGMEIDLPEPFANLLK